MSILVITTGGTIGAVAHNKLKKPDPVQIMPMSGVDPVRDALRVGGLAVYGAHYHAFEHRDSKHIDDLYRAKLMALIEQASEKHVLITHGTDALMQTADYIFSCRQKTTGLKDKVILFTGAMVPLACGPESDGYMNLGFSLEQLAHGHLAAAIYIVLCDFTDTQKRQGWAPRLYPFAPGRYEKYYDPDDARYCRLRESEAALGTQCS